ncbi:PspC domain-containing protein [Sphingopyxis solisilvae]|uniref:PspC domain-containing protein n=1 Tax=Sphingopyxis solisilvae TaxID=1886788 RepID=UPI001E427254|nr:PspC domain-containing protein [Sphingopyxis solisilvae]
MTIGWRNFPINGIESRDEQAVTVGAAGKSLGNARTGKIGTAFALQGSETRGPTRSQEDKKKMDTDTTNLFRRRDTFFGICEAVGQDFGFNPLWLRLAIVAPLFFFPVQTFIGYFALGAVVLASRLIFPAKSNAVAPALTVATDSAPREEKAEEFALAA